MLSFDALFPEGGMLISFISVCIPHIILFAAALFSIKTVLRENIRDKKHTMKSYFMTILISSLGIAFFQLFHISQMHRSSYSIKDWLTMLPAVLIIIPLQSAAEELLFRYPLIRLIESRRTIIPASMISGALFLLFHMVANTEFRDNPSFFLYLYYFLFGFCALALTAYSNDIMYTIIIHAVNNIFVLTVAGYTSSSLQTAPIFITEGVPSPLLSVMTLTAVFSAVFLYLRGENNAKEKEKAE